MSDETRIEPPRTADEKTSLVSYLDYQRETIIKKLVGLSEADARRAMPPSTLTLLGLTKHLAFVERSWFQKTFADRDVSFPWSKADPDADLRIEENETIPGIIEFYRAEIAIANQIIAEHDLSETVVRNGRETSLRWIVLHMIEETARHAGHADILRESIDGVTGE
jgi:uncharacterized damage-inducible protein DinB